MLLLASLLACTAASDASAVTATPTVAFVSPHDGDTVSAGDVELSIAVENFQLTDPSKHNEGEPEGYLQVAWVDGDDSSSIETGETTPTISITTPGTWTLTADLLFTDGDGMDEEFADFEAASVTITVE